MNYAMIDQAVIESLKEIAGNDPAFLPELQALYLKQYEERAPEIARLAEKGDLPKIAAIAHAIKSSSGLIGAMNFHQLCATLERSACEGDARAIASLLPAFQQAFRQAAGAVQSISDFKRAA